MTLAFRTNVRAGAYALLTGFQTANPTLLHETHPVRPASFRPPLGFVGEINEPSLYADMQTRQRHPRVSIYLVQGSYDNAETVSRQDVLVDAFLDYCYANLGIAGAATLLEPSSTDDVPLTVNTPTGPLYYSATQFVLEGTASEGR